MARQRRFDNDVLSALQAGPSTLQDLCLSISGEYVRGSSIQTCMSRSLRRLEAEGKIEKAAEPQVTVRVIREVDRSDWKVMQSEFLEDREQGKHRRVRDEVYAPRTERVEARHKRTVWQLPAEGIKGDQV